MLTFEGLGLLIGRDDDQMEIPPNQPGSMGTRRSCLFTPPRNADYTFFIASDN